MQKMFHEADLLVLEDRSNSRVRSFKIFEDKQVFPEIYENDEFQPLDKEEKHDDDPVEDEPEEATASIPPEEALGRLQGIQCQTRA